LGVWRYDSRFIFKNKHIGNTVDALPLFQKVAISEHTNFPKGSYTVEYELKSKDTEERKYKKREGEKKDIRKV
jgi:hypothetical protein